MVYFTSCEQRQNPGVRDKEQQMDTARHQEARCHSQNCQTADDLIEIFHAGVGQGPVLSCLVCDTIQYRDNVVKLNVTSLPNCDAVEECTAENGADRSWLCRSCQRFFKTRAVSTYGCCKWNEIPFCAR